LNVKLEVVEIRAIAELQLAFQKAGKHKPDAIIILSSPNFGTNPKLTADLTIEHHIPTTTLAVCNSNSERLRPNSFVSTSRNASTPLIVRRSTSPDGYRTLNREFNRVSRVLFGPGRAAIRLLRYGLWG
jgi:hypothetical protein